MVTKRPIMIIVIYFKALEQKTPIFILLICFNFLVQQSSIEYNGLIMNLILSIWREPAL